MNNPRQRFGFARLADVSLAVRPAVRRLLETVTASRHIYRMQKGHLAQEF